MLRSAISEISIFPPTSYDTENIQDPNCRKVFSSLFTGCHIRLIHYSPDVPIKLRTEIHGTIKGQGRTKIFHITGGIVFGLGMHNLCNHGSNIYCIKRGKCETLSFMSFLDKILLLLDDDYHIMKLLINEKIANRFTALGMTSFK
jgi:hypothetical protein